jgi:hypothetical protein
MGERTSHAPGTFSWVDLSTADVDPANPTVAFDVIDGPLDP